MSAASAVVELGRRWVAAELSADTATLDAITTEDFTLVGPLGFVLDKAAWLGRYRSGDLHFEELAWEDVSVRDHGPAAIAIGRQRQRAAYRGQPNEGEFRVTQILVHEGGGWLLAGMHIGPLTTVPPAG